MKYNIYGKYTKFGGTRKKMMIGSYQNGISTRARVTRT